MKVIQKADESVEVKNLTPEDTTPFPVCPKCGGSMKTPHPARFSMDNRYADYLRKMKAIAYQKTDNTDRD
jgi:rRNA maturation protein Nop10